MDSEELKRWSKAPAVSLNKKPIDMKTRIMLVDDHTILREALHTVLDLEKDIDVVAEAADGIEAFRIAKEVQPDIVIMDIGMPGLDGIAVTRKLIADNPKLKVLALSHYLDRHFVLQMLDAGASGYLVKSAGSRELLRAIRGVSNSKTYLSPEIASVVVDTMRSKTTAREPRTEQLGRREREVLSLLADGKTSPEIAARLHLATSTVEAHRRNIMRKLDLHSIAELTKYAIRQGLTAA